MDTRAFAPTGVLPVGHSWSPHDSVCMELSASTIYLRPGHVSRIGCEFGSVQDNKSGDKRSPWRTPFTMHGTRQAFILKHSWIFLLMLKLYPLHHSKSSRSRVQPLKNINSCIPTYLGDPSVLTLGIQTGLGIPFTSCEENICATDGARCTNTLFNRCFITINKHMLTA